MKLNFYAKAFAFAALASVSVAQAGPDIGQVTVNSVFEGGVSETVTLGNQSENAPYVGVFNSTVQFNAQSPENILAQCTTPFLETNEGQPYQIIAEISGVVEFGQQVANELGYIESLTPATPDQSAAIANVVWLLTNPGIKFSGENSDVQNLTAEYYQWALNNASQNSYGANVFWLEVAVGQSQVSDQLIPEGLPSLTGLGIGISALAGLRQAAARSPGFLRFGKLAGQALQAGEHVAPYLRFVPK